MIVIKTKVLIGILIIILIIMFFNINKSNAYDSFGIRDVIGGADNFINAASNENSKIEISKADFRQTINLLTATLIIISICVATIIAVVLGIQFMIGSAEEKAQVKESMVPFVVGCAVAFGAFGIWSIFLSIANNL